jgi:hypothetical protein
VGDGRHVPVLRSRGPRFGPSHTGRTGQAGIDTSGGFSQEVPGPSPSPRARGAEPAAFVQANGDFAVAVSTYADAADTDDESADTAVRPYRNVYVFRLDRLDGLVVGIEEYANPITFRRTFVPMD